MIYKFVNSFGSSVMIPKFTSPNFSKLKKLLMKVTPEESNHINLKSEKGTRVVTDIDDTVKSSGGVKIFGIALGGIDVSKIQQKLL